AGAQLVEGDTAAEHEVHAAEHPALRPRPQVKGEHVEDSAAVGFQRFMGNGNVLARTGRRARGFREVRDRAGPGRVADYGEARLPISRPEVFVSAQRHAGLELLQRRDRIESMLLAEAG